MSSVQEVDVLQVTHMNFTNNEPKSQLQCTRSMFSSPDGGARHGIATDMQDVVVSGVRMTMGDEVVFGFPFGDGS